MGIIICMIKTDQELNLHGDQLKKGEDKPEGRGGGSGGAREASQVVKMGWRRKE